MSKQPEEEVRKLEIQIRNLEENLDELRTDYMKKTGHLTPRRLKDFDWKWMIFITLGFAFISSIVYLLGISKKGQTLNTGIPAFFYNTEIAYFSILNMYVIIMILIPQSNKISGYQTLALISGFWCAHWLIYDWAWWALTIGMGVTSLEGFWTGHFTSPLVVPSPPMWMFLIWAILGGIMALYCFTIPRRYRELLPPTLWLYIAYPHASIMDSIGLESDMILLIGIILIIISFSIATYYTIRRFKEGIPEWMKKRKKFFEKFTKKNWKFDPLTGPTLVIIIIMLLLMHLFLVFIPVIGLFLGFIPWFLVPLFYVIFKSSSIRKYSRVLQILFAIFIIAFFIAVMVAMHYFSL
jgi:hypothetical protein